MVEQFNSTKVCLSAHALCASPLMSFYKLRTYFMNLFLVTTHMHPLSVPITNPLAAFVQGNSFA